MRATRCRRRGSRGQALYELACILPLMIGLFVGGYSMTESITDDQLVNVAIGQAARYGAQVGNNGYTAAKTAALCQVSNVDPCQADKLIIGTLLPLLQQMISVTVTEVDIYQPPTCTPNATEAYVLSSCPAHVGYVAASDLAERYRGDGTLIGNGAAGVYTLDKRVQGSPNEASIGVSVIYNYVPPTHVFSLTLTQFCAYRLSPA
jgi:hypothetical protein